MSTPAPPDAPAPPSAGLAEHFDPAESPQTYWHATGGPTPVAVDRLDGDADCEVAIVGGGIAGLSAALHLARDYGIAVRVLEAGAIGWGASGRSGGFCTPGGIRHGWRRLARRFGIEEARRWFAAQKTAVELVADIARRHRIDLRRAGEGEYLVAHRPGRMAGLEREAAFLREHFGERCDLLRRAELEERGIALEEAHGALYLPCGFGLHPLRYVRGLARAATEYGARIHERSPAVAWRLENGFHRLLTPGGSVWTRRVLVATDGYAPEMLRPELRGQVLPALSSILVTRPLTPSERDAQGWREPALVADTRRLLFYMRLLGDGRLLFGARGGLTATPAAFRERRRWLDSCLRQRFPAWRHVAVEHAWWGLVALSRDGLPHLAPVPGLPRTWRIGPYNGSGIAMATLLGRLAAATLAGAKPPEPLPRALARPLPRIPFPSLRRLYLAAAYLGFHIADEWL